MDRTVRTVAWLLFVSGACALVFQTAWFREFRLVFGASTPASAAVLAIFMGGLGLGNALLGRRADVAVNPLRLYAQWELSISLLSAASPLLVAVIRSVYLALGGQETLGIVGATLVRLILSTLVLGLPTFLMGGTLPAAARAATAPDDAGRRSVGWLYGLNTLGAVLGTLLSTFFLLEQFGTHGTLWIACGANLLNALAAWRLSHALSPANAQAALPAEPEKTRARPASRRPMAQDAGATSTEASDALPPWVWYFAAALVGCAFFLMEIVWYRMLSPILGGTTFTFGLILAVALMGIGLGGALYPLLFRDRRPDLFSFSLTLGWEALALAIPFALGDRIAVLAAVLRSLAYYGFFGQALGWLAITLIVVFPAAVVSGVQFPLLIALVGQGNRNIGKEVGLAFGANTVGAMVGSLAGGFGLLGILSATGVWQAVVIGLGMLAVALMLLDFRALRRADRLLLPSGLVGLAALCLTVTGPTAVWRHRGIGVGRANLPVATRVELRKWMNAGRRHILWEADGRESAIAINVQGGASFIVNGKSDGNAIADAPTQIMLGALGVLLHPAPEDGLVIGLGTGESAGWMAHMPMIQSVEVVELEPAVATMAEVAAPLNHNVLTHPKIRVIYNDARELLQTTVRRYDLIASEPSNPYRSGVSSLYTHEFYTAASRRLRPGGLFLQWLQAYEVDAATIGTVIATLGRTFPHIEIWQTQRSDLVLVCSGQPLAYRAADLRRRMAIPALRDALRIAWQTTSLEGVLGHLIAGERYAKSVASASDVVNTDNRNVLEYAFARTVGRHGDSLADLLYDEAVRAGLHVPDRLAEGVDWRAVADLRLLRRAAESASPIGDVPADDVSARLNAIRMLRQDDFAGAARIWEAAPLPQEFAEQLRAGLALAEAGSPKAAESIAALRVLAPLDADALDAILAVRQEKPAAAAQLLEQLYIRLRTDASANENIIERTLLIADHLAHAHSDHAPQIFQSLSQPFAVYLLEQKRVETLCSVGRKVGIEALAAAIELVEPYPPWNAAMLELRVATYGRIRHPRLARARRELAEFRSQSGESSVLRPR